MKLYRHARPARPPDDIPLELVQYIISYVIADTSAKYRQRTLRKCNLVSKLWYSATISQLYERPILTNGNFDKFSRTLCPPVNSHIAKTGLEHFVRELDMGNLAYESSKSETARLIRRTGSSLEKFVAPAVSFGITSHTPLSKCRNLRSLDLSHVFYDLDLQQMLKITRNLTILASLNMPPNVFGRQRHFPSTNWPPNLEILQINGAVPNDNRCWSELSRNWPTSLHTLILDQATANGPFTPPTYNASHLSIGQIKNLRLGFFRQDIGMGLIYPNIMDDLLSFCRSAKTLSVPGPWLEQQRDGLTEHIQSLELRSARDNLGGDRVTPETVLPLTGGEWPKLWQLRVANQWTLSEIEDSNILKDFEGIARHLRQTAMTMSCDANKVFLCEPDERFMAF